MSVYILQEDGEFLLQDDGGKILYESALEFQEAEVALIMVGGMMRKVLIRRRGI